ncbi:MAG: adenine phosphoribosyltransferase [Paludibacteraceae bacterium]|nr:adenine phosphoribosyltransferase [Paludibacteraceae bacterium]
MTAEEVKQAIRNVPDFPIKGIQFKDITTALAKPECLRWMRDEIVERYRGLGITQVVGVESRGFILASAIAIEIGAGFVPIRKHNKLPAETVSVTYAKEYGEDIVQIHADALNSNDVVLIHDDILATGGSMEAAINLVKKLGVKKIYVNCIIELEGLHGREYLAGKADAIDCLFGIEVDE